MMYLLRSRPLVSSMNASVRSTQFCQHLFLLANHLWFEGNGRLAPDYAGFHNHHWNVKSLEKGTHFGGLWSSLSVRLRMARSIALRWPTSSPADQRPSSRPRFPLLRWNGISSAQEFPLRAS